MLTSLEDLKLEALATLTRDEISRLHGRQAEIHKRLWKLHKATGDMLSEFLNPMVEIGFLDLALDDGLAGKFPVAYTVSRNGEKPTASTWGELVKKLSDLLDSTEAFTVRQERKQENNTKQPVVADAAPAAEPQR